MKTKIFAVLSVMLVLSGCFIQSLHPFYKEKDVVFRSEIIGSWLDSDSTKWTFKQNKRVKGFLGTDTTPDNSYLVKFKTKDKEESPEFVVHLFKLKEQYYLDFYPAQIDVNDMLAYHLVATHSLAKFETFDRSNIKISWFNQEWLKTLFEQNRIKIAHEVLEPGTMDSNKTYVLTASTDELQKFMVKYGTDPNAFKKIWEGTTKSKNEEAFCFNLKRINE